MGIIEFHMKLFLLLCGVCGVDSFSHLPARVRLLTKSPNLKDEKVVIQSVVPSVKGLLTKKSPNLEEGEGVIQSVVPSVRGGSIFPMSQILPPTYLKLTLLSFLTTSIGFNKFVFFFSLGYGLTMTAMSSTVLFGLPNLPLLPKLHVAAFGIYGIRLFAFLLNRWRIPSQRAKIEKRENSVTLKSKLSIWIFAGLLYPAMFSPAWFHATTANSLCCSTLSHLKVPGLAVMYLGLLLESVADFQKSCAKKKSDSFVSTGVWKYSRHANYLGEILFYVGSGLAGTSSFAKSPLRGATALIGTIGIINTMLSATKRLDKSQAEKYGEVTGYKEYLASSKPLAW